MQKKRTHTHTHIHTPTQYNTYVYIHIVSNHDTEQLITATCGGMWRVVVNQVQFPQVSLASK